MWVHLKNMKLKKPDTQKGHTVHASNYMKYPETESSWGQSNLVEEAGG